MDVESKQILGTAHAKGAKHDFALFRDNDPHLQPDVWVVADSGYQGLASHHPQTSFNERFFGSAALCVERAGLPRYRGVYS